MNTILNLANLLSHLLGTSTLSLNIFKVVEFFSLKPIEIVFYRTVFTRLFSDHDIEQVALIFSRLSSKLELFHVRESLQSFFANAFRKSSLKNRELFTEEESKKIKAALKDIKLIFRQASTNLV